MGSGFVVPAAGPRLVRTFGRRSPRSTAWARDWARRAQVELGGSVEHAERGRPASDQLSPHELQIALQVAGGATNAEAAAALFVTRKTIEFHLRNVYRKLGIRSRTELAALMASQRSIRPRTVERPDTAPSAPSLDS